MSSFACVILPWTKERTTCSKSANAHVAVQDALAKKLVTSEFSKTMEWKQSPRPCYDMVEEYNRSLDEYKDKVNGSTRACAQRGERRKITCRGTMQQPRGLSKEWRIETKIYTSCFVSGISRSIRPTRGSPLSYWKSPISCWSLAPSGMRRRRIFLSLSTHEYQMRCDSFSSLPALP